MSYSNQTTTPPNRDSIEAHLKNISWHMKVLSDNLTKLVELQLRKESQTPKEQLPF